MIPIDTNPDAARRAVATAVVVALSLAGCATVPPLDASALPAAPAAFKEGDGRWTAVAPADARPRGTWWTAFSDPVLDDLVARAERGNSSIQVAAARLEQARALVRSARAERSVQVGAGAGVVRERDLVTEGRASTAISAGADLSYEVDLFGRLARAQDAATRDAQAREALVQSTRLLVQANVAQTYFTLRAVDVERGLVRATVEAYRQTLRVTERRHEFGDLGELDVVRVTSEVSATESEALALDRARAQLEHALAVLVGEVASNFNLTESGWHSALPVVPAGVPGSVLARRPDVAAAQRTLLAAQARVGVAKAAWFPDLVLTGSAGYASPELGDLFKWSARAWSAGALLSLPLFDGGRRQAAVQSAVAELDAALASTREQILVAFKEVEDELASLRLLADQRQAQERAVAAASRATELSAVRYRNGLVSQLELLDAQRTELRNRRAALHVRAAQYQATVGLIRALGGTWDAPPAESSATAAVARWGGR